MESVNKSNNWRQGGRLKSFTETEKMFYFKLQVFRGKTPKGPKIDTFNISTINENVIKTIKETSEGSFIVAAGYLAAGKPYTRWFGTSSQFCTEVEILTHPKDLADSNYESVMNIIKNYEKK